MGIKYLILFILIAAGHCDDGPLLKTPLGKIRGSLRTTNGGRKYSAFEGIPFAKPPIDERRFEEPEPIEPWSGTWEANFTTECVQSILGNFTFIKEASEDCLHINVYVPRELPNPQEKLEVIVHIHGGAYLYGNGHFYTDPQYLLDYDVIFVTFNYRLGIFGFLSTEDDVVPGNNGMKDQVLALKWVQENIASFGGNPDSVTLTGASAGASAVHLHYLSDMSKGLFHRGFSQSGCALNPWSIQEAPLKKAKILAEAVGCPTSSSQDLVQCLKQRPYKHLLAKIGLFFGYGYLPFAPFAPVVEKGAKSFLNEDPYVLLTQGKVIDVPWIASTTAHEGFITFAFTGDDLQTINDRWEELSPFLLDYNYTLPEESKKTAAKKIKEFYLQDQSITNETLLQASEIFSDRLFLLGAETAVREQSKVTKSSIYFYLFNYPGDTESKIVNHGADGKYFFGDFFTGQRLTPNELKMRDVLLEMLISYVKTGKPTITGVNWEPTEHEDLTYLKIDGFTPENMKLQRVKALTPREFWKSLRLRENENLIVTKDEL